MHATGRYRRHSLVEMLQDEFGFDKVYSEFHVPYRPVGPDTSIPPVAINRLDRLTSGLMILPLNADLARALTTEFMNGSVRKEYVARCKGEFPVYVSPADLNMTINILTCWICLERRLFARNHY